MSGGLYPLVTFGMSETKNVGENFKMLVTVIAILVNNIPTSKFSHSQIVTNFKSPKIKLNFSRVFFYKNKSLEI